MIKLMGIASAIRVVADSIYIQQQQENTGAEDDLLDNMKEKIEEIWALIETFEKEQAS